MDPDLALFSGSDIQRICSMATRKLLRKKVISGQSGLQITIQDLQECIKTIRPLNETWRKKFEAWSNTL